MSGETTLYDLRDGLDIQHRYIDGEIVNANIPGDELLLRQASPSVHESVHQSLNYNDRLSDGPDQRVHYSLLNDGVTSPDITLVCLQVQGRFQDEGTTDGLAELVAANPERRFLVYDNLGYGLSDRMPRLVAQELKFTGRFDLYAEIVYGALASIIEDHDNLDMLTYSEGGLIGTEMVHLTKGVNSLIVFDTPATPRPLGDLFTRFAKLERKHGEAYLEALRLSGQQMPGWDLSRKKIAAFVLRDAISGRTTIQYREAKAMSVGAYVDALAAALPNINESYTFLSPDYSEMNAPDFIRRMIGDAAATAKRLPRKVQQVTFNGTHAFAYGNPRAQHALESYALDLVA